MVSSELASTSLQGAPIGAKGDRARDKITTWVQGINPGHEAGDRAEDQYYNSIAGIGTDSSRIS